MTKARDLANASTALSAVSATELGYLDGVTSAVQTQIDAKLASSTAATTYVANALADAKGDIFVASADNTVTRFPVSTSNGDTIVADSSTSTGLRYNGSAISKNGLYNSAFDIMQRAGTPTTGITVTGGNAYTFDRWNAWMLSGGSSAIISRQSVGDTTNLPFIRYCSRFRRATGNSDTQIMIYGQPLETSDAIRFAGQTVTFSFYARKGAGYSQTGSALNAQIWGSTATDGSLQTIESTGRTTNANLNATLTTTWQRFSTTASIPTTATQLAPVFITTPTGTAGADDYYEVTGLQLELGSVATPYNRMTGTIQGELAACQRYYQRFTSLNGASYFGMGFVGNATTATVYIPFPVSMRSVSLTFDYSNIRLNDYNNAYTISAISGGATYSSGNGQFLTATSSGMTTYRPIAIDSTGTGYLAFNGEL